MVVIWVASLIEKWELNLVNEMDCLKADWKVNQIEEMMGK
jgi:hypothetical protein